MDEIVKTVFERNKERKLLTDDDVKKICFIILKKKGYNSVKYVKVLPNNPSDPHCAGIYYNEYIFFFLKEIINMLQNKFENFSKMYTIDGANADVYNYLYLNIIFHELAHVRQQAIVDSKHSSIEQKLFSMFLSLSKNRDFYDENYQDLLTEVNANNIAAINTNSIYTKLPNNFLTKNDWQVYQSYLLKIMLYDNYEIIPKKDDILSPAERVVDNFDEEVLFYLDTTLTECIHLIYDTDKLTLYKKLILGLPISYAEYADVNLIGDRLYSGDKINVVKKLQKKLNSTNS